jgi:hypothetical protein
MDSVEAGVRGRGRIRARQTALMAKLAPSRPNDQATPAAATNTPPSAGPSSWRANTRLNEDIALAWTSNPSGSSWGTIAVEAGEKNASATPNSTDRASSPARVSECSATRMAIAVTAAPRPRSEASMASRGAIRSTTAPPSSNSRMVGTSLAASTAANASGRSSTRKVSSARATVKIPSPATDTACPDHSSAKSRWRRTTGSPDPVRRKRVLMRLESIGAG